MPSSRITRPRSFALTRTNACPNDMRRARNANRPRLSLMTGRSCGLPRLAGKHLRFPSGKIAFARFRVNLSKSARKFRSRERESKRDRGNSPEVRPGGRNIVVSYFNSRRHVSDRRKKLLIDPPVAELFLNVRQILEYFSLLVFILSDVGINLNVCACANF